MVAVKMNAPGSNSAAPASSKGRLTQVTETDSRGRVITVKRPGIVQRMQLMELLGGAACEINTVFYTYYCAASVISIDEDPVPFPESRLALDGLLAELDDAGITAVGVAIERLDAGEKADRDVVKK